MSDRATTIVRALAVLALGASACVLHQPGIVVEVRLDLRMPASLASSTLTLVELVPCPGTTDPLAHHHDESAPFGLSLAAPETVWLTPRAGHYCDLRMQLEGSNVATRQAVVRIACGGVPRQLVLDASEVDHEHTLVLRTASSDRESGPTSEDPPQRTLEHFLRTLEVEACH